MEGHQSWNWEEIFRNDHLGRSEKLFTSRFGITTLTLDVGQFWWLVKSDRILLNAGFRSPRFRAEDSQQKYRERGVSMGGEIFNSIATCRCLAFGLVTWRKLGGRSARPCVLVDFCCFFLLVTLQVRHTEMVLDRGRVGSLNLNLLIKQCTCPTQAIEVKNGNGIEAGGWIAHPEDAELQIMEECGSFPRPLSLQHKASFSFNDCTGLEWTGVSCRPLCRSYNRILAGKTGEM